MRPREYFDQFPIQEETGYIFALIPPDCETLFHMYIKAPIEKIELENKKAVCISLNDLERGSDRMNSVWENLYKATVIIADVTGFEKEVIFYLAAALTKKEKVIIIADKALESKQAHSFNIDNSIVDYYDTNNLIELSNRILWRLNKWKVFEAPRIKSVKASALMSDVRKLRNEKKYAIALLLLEKIDTIEPNNWYIHKEWGVTLKNNEEYDRARMNLEKALTLTKKNLNKSDIYIELAGLYKQMRREEDAILAFEKAESFDPKNPVLYAKWAKVFAELENYNQAVEKITEALKLDKNNEEYRQQLDLYDQKFPETYSTETSELEFQIDRTITVTISGTRLKFTLLYKEYPLVGPEYITQLVGERKEIFSDLNKISLSMTRIASREYSNEENRMSCMDYVEGIGKKLYKKLIPKGIKKIIEELDSGLTVCIQTDEQWIPWELLHDGRGFLGERFLLLRTPRNGMENPESITSQVDSSSKIEKVLHVLGGNLNGNYSTTAKSMFTKYIHPDRLTTQERICFATLFAKIESPDFIHFTCHGFSKDDQSYLQIANTEDVELNVGLTVLENDRFKIKKGSFVFANACGSSNPSSFLGELNNFGCAFLEKGAALFIGTIGTVPVKFALEFADVFYRILFSQSYSIPEAFRKTKNELKSNDNFFHLLYCLYSNPTYLSGKNHNI